MAAPPPSDSMEMAALRHAAAMALAPVRHRRAQQRPFRHVVSLGTHCYAAQLIRSVGLKRASYPFDWIFASPAAVVDMVEDGFARFLDPRQFVPVPLARRHEPGAGLCAHAYYRDALAVPLMFAHRDPTEPDQLAYYRRCVARFRAVASGADKALFLMLCANNRANMRDFERLCARFDTAGPDNVLLCINIVDRGDVLAAGMQTERWIGRHRLLTYRATSALTALEFANPLDELFLRSVLLQLDWDLA